MILPGNVGNASPVEDIHQAWGEYVDYKQDIKDTKEQYSALMSYWFSSEFDAATSTFSTNTHARIHYINTNGTVSIIGSYIFEPHLNSYQKLLVP